MNPILYIVSIFYHWFSTRKSSKIIAYESALWGFVVVLFSNFMAFSKILNLNINLNLNKYSNVENYLIVGTGILVGGFILSIFAPRKKVKSINYDLRDESVDFTIMFVYLIGSFGLLIFLY